MAWIQDVKDVIDWFERGRTVRDLYGLVRTISSERRIAAVEKRLRNLGPARLTRDPYFFLANLYSDLPILTGDSGPFPVGVLEIDPARGAAPDLLLGSLNSTPASTVVHRPDLVEALSRQGAKLWDGITFGLTQVELTKEGAVERIDGHLTRYFSTVASADYLELEALFAFSKKEGQLVLEDLPARKSALSGFVSPLECLLRGGGVDGSLAVSTLVVYRREGGFWAIADVRSNEVAVQKDLYHVVPSFMFQPVVSAGDQTHAEWSITHNVFREYLEELFSVPEVEPLGSRPLSPTYFYSHPNLVLLRTLLDAGGASLVNTGVAFNLLNHRCEVCTLLLIEDEEWYSRQERADFSQSSPLVYLQLNNEYWQTRAQEPAQPCLTSMPVEDKRWRRVLQPYNIVPPGAAALYLGIRECCRRTGTPTPEWLSHYRTRTETPPETPP
jgi:hypothetical protein